MKKYYSKIDPEKILHIVKRISDIEKQDQHRIDIIDPLNFIQCSCLKMPKDKTFKPHRHIFKPNRNSIVIAQESWVVIRGKVNCTFYDIDDSWLVSTILEPGDACFTLEGGHNYRAIEENTIVYEYKTGPYEGQSKDKIFIT